jgi:hypothetical protein
VIASDDENQSINQLGSFACFLVAESGRPLLKAKL